MGGYEMSEMREMWEIMEVRVIRWVDILCRDATRLHNWDYGDGRVDAAQPHSRYRCIWWGTAYAGCGATRHLSRRSLARAMPAKARGALLVQPQAAPAVSGGG